MAGPSEEHKSVEDLAVVDVAFQIQQYDSAEAVDGAHLEIPSALPQAQEGTGAPRLSCRQGEPVWTEVCQSSVNIFIFFTTYSKISSSI